MRCRTIFLLHFVLSRWSIKTWTSGACGVGGGGECERTSRTPSPHGPEHHTIRKKEEEEEGEGEKKEQHTDLYEDIRGWSPIQFLTPIDRV